MHLSALDKLKQVDEQLTNQATLLAEIISNLKFEPVYEFELGSEIAPMPVHVLGRKGIYFFELKNEYLAENNAGFTLQGFSQLWKEGKVTWVPGIKKRRILAHNSLSEWVPLYLGKSRNVGARIAEHIFQEEGKTTFSMKLRARNNLWNKWFRVSWIPLDVENYDMLAPAIERALRDIKNPIVGKQ